MFMQRIYDFFDTDLGAGLLASGIVSLAGIAAICVW